jgi:hypothetical protein
MKACIVISESSYINCSDKEPEEVIPKDQGYDEVVKGSAYI